MATNYTTKTAALKATMADIRKVEATQVMVSPDGKASSKKEDVLSLINKAAESAAIQVGRDADKNWSVDENEITKGVKKISFMGDYVNVVEVPGSNEVKLYIGENKSLEEADRNGLSATLPTTENVLLYTDATDDYALKAGATANATSTAAVVTAVDAGYGATQFTANGGSFTTDQTDCIWVRTTYNYGNPSAWGKASLAINRGTYNRNEVTPTESTVTPAAFTADTAKGEVALPSGVTMNVGNYILTAEADAKYGKVPGRCETAYNFTVNWNAIATKGGGNIKVEWGLGAADATDATKPASTVKIVSYERYFTEKKSVAMSSVSATVTTPSYTSKVSGLEYVGKGTTVTVTTSDITDSQYKAAKGTKRLTVVAGGTTTTYSTDELTCTGDKTTSAAVYKLDGSSPKSNVIALSSTGNGSATITAQPHGYNDGTARSATSVANFWGSIPASTDSKENFGIENTIASGGYRMAKVDSAEGSYDNTAAVNAEGMLASIPGTSYTNLVQAVCQYGSLKHPSKADADGHGQKPYSDITTDAVFIRKFKPSSDKGFTLSGTNIGAAKAVYWYDGATYNLISTAKPGVYEPSTGSLKVTWSSALHQPYTTDGRNIMIIIVMGSGNANIGALTLA